MSKVIVEDIKDFELEHIFDCGQCFRWEKQQDGSYTGIAFGKVVNMKVQAQTEEPKAKLNLIIDNCTQKDYEEIWKSYLDMDTDYGKIKETLSDGDATMAEAISYGQGIRLLRQDLWETLVSFIISQNNNIPRIKGCIENLSKYFGTSAGIYGGKEYFDIPTAKQLASLTVDDLSPVRLGYRARYIIETARAVAEGGLPTCEEDLSALCGVGPKVANCILLFGMGKHESFPIDVWVKRVMYQLYGIPEEDMKAMKKFADEHFGQLGGVAQQYLFYYIRQTTK